MRTACTRARRSCWRITSGRQRRPRRRVRRNRWARGKSETMRAASPAPSRHPQSKNAYKRATASVMATASPEIRAIYWDIGGVLLTNGWDHEERARVLGQFAIPREEYEARHPDANDRWERGELSDDEFLKETVFFKERSFTPAQFLEAVRAQSKWLPGGAKNVIAALRE